LQPAAQHDLLGAGCVVAQQVVLCRGLQLLALVFIALTVRRALAGRAADLVEARRRFRLLVVGAAVLFAVAIVIGESWSAGAPSPALSLGQAVALLALAAGLAWARLAFVPAAPGREALPGLPAAEAPSPVADDPQDSALLETLRRLMQMERVYRQEGFGVAALAERMQIPEYRLRRLINRRLGHRNFTAFVNGYRLEEAKAALADPAQAAVPVLTIALDAGFQSIGPFNRAFKAATGLTPTEYRRRHAG